MLSVFQKKIVGYAITTAAIFVLGAFIVLMLKLFGVFLNTFYYVLLPVAIALIFSYMTEPIVVWLSKKLKVSKSSACAICFAVIFIMLIAVVAFGIPYVASQLMQMYNHFPEFVNRIGEYMSEHAPETKEAIIEKLQILHEKVVNIEPTGDGRALKKIMSTAGFVSSEIYAICSFIAAMAVVPVYLYYILISDFDFFAWVDSRISFLNESTRENILFFLRRFSEIMQSFFRGQLLIASIMGLMLGVSLRLSGVKFGFILGFTAGLLNIIPYFGTIIGLGIILPVAFFQAGGGLFLSAVGLVIFIIVQLIEGYYLTPKIMGDKTGLHPTVIIFSVFFWGTALDGILGMILAIPFSALVVAMYPKLHSYFSNIRIGKSN